MRDAPRLVYADRSGNIRDHPTLLMLCQSGPGFRRPEPEELMPLPASSDLFLLPGRRPAGLNPVDGSHREGPGLAVAAFAAPGHTLSAHPAYHEDAAAPTLPLFAYGAVGYARGKFWVCASKVDEDRRQFFSAANLRGITAGSAKLLRQFPRNRLVGHIINNCVRRYACPAARNFALGRYEAPLPTARSCNAACIGCISAPQQDAPVAETPQCRLAFTPSSQEIAEVMRIHESREKVRPIYSFGQGCEGDPLVNAPLLAESIRIFRDNGGHGTVNCNTNGSNPAGVAMLADAGLTSLRVSLNSAMPQNYEAYYRPRGYSFADVRKSICIARSKGIFVSLNLLYFPGITDTAPELEYLSDLVRTCGVAMIQWRNLNIDPAWYRKRMPAAEPMGTLDFMRALKKCCPWLRYGYFNPWLGDSAKLDAPMPA